MKKNKWILVSRVGPNSQHDLWLKGSDRKYDVFLSAYTSDISVPEGCGIFHEFRIGSKVSGYHHILNEHPDLLTQYDYIALFDDDIVVNTQELNKLFSICAQHNLKIAQPSLTQNSFFTYAATLQQKALKLRFVNFVEMMCPIFRADVLEDVKSLYGEGFESGIDLIWCNASFQEKTDFAIIDEVPVIHSMPVGGNKGANGFTGGKVYEDDIYMILAKYKLNWIPCVPYFAIHISGKEINSRAIIFFHAVKCFTAILKKPQFWLRCRSVLVHLKHVATKTAVNHKVNLESE